MRASTDQRFNRLRELQTKVECELPAISRAIASTEQELSQLEELLLPAGGRPLAENASLVLFGSIARGESTSQSDLDWTLLVNGEVDRQHFSVFQTIRKELRKAGRIAPGETGAFGGLAFGHDLVHRIGGQDDTNKNLTLRMLLLLESISVGADEPRRAVIRVILQRYLADDPYWTYKPNGKIPRFLLNDIIRFWRTMAVDFADKLHDQEGEKWGLRNTKLRFSRKLIFLTGMLGCFSVQLHQPKFSSDRDRTVEEAIAHFESYFSRPSLEILADELLLAAATSELCRTIFSAYDQFLGILDDTDSRNQLVEIARVSRTTNPLFKEIRDSSHKFNNALLEWLYTPRTPLSELVRQYGLF